MPSITPIALAHACPQRLDHFGENRSLLDWPRPTSHGRRMAPYSDVGSRYDHDGDEGKVAA